MSIRSFHAKENIMNVTTAPTTQSQAEDVIKAHKPQLSDAITRAVENGLIPNHKEVQPEIDKVALTTGIVIKTRLNFMSKEARRWLSDALVTAAESSLVSSKTPKTATVCSAKTKVEPFDDGNGWYSLHLIVKLNPTSPSAFFQA